MEGSGLRWRGCQQYLAKGMIPKLLWGSRFELMQITTESIIAPYLFARALYFEITVTSAPGILPNLEGQVQYVPVVSRCSRPRSGSSLITFGCNSTRKNIEQAAPYFGSSCSRLDSAHGVSPPPAPLRVILPHKTIKPSRGPSPVSHPSASYQLPCALGWVSLLTRPPRSFSHPKRPKRRARFASETRTLKPNHAARFPHRPWAPRRRKQS